MNKLSTIEMAGILLLIIGGINWLLVGLFNLNLVTMLLGDGTILSRAVFVLVGLAALYVFTFGRKLRKE